MFVTTAFMKAGMPSKQDRQTCDAWNCNVNIVHTEIICCPDSSWDPHSVQIQVSAVHVYASAHVCTHVCTHVWTHVYIHRPFACLDSSMVRYIMFVCCESASLSVSASSHPWLDNFPSSAEDMASLKTSQTERSKYEL